MENVSKLIMGKGSEVVNFICGQSQANSKLDVEKLFGLLQEKCETDQLSKKDCILLIGMTGAGKTTTANFLAGSKLQERDAPEGKLNFKTKRKGTKKTIIEVADKSAGLVIGHSGNSETKRLGILNCTIPKFREVMVIDSPGLEDTAGIECDIANYASLAQVLRCCASVRPVLLINCQGLNADRSKRLKTLLDLVTRFFVPIKQHQANISVLFTHCNPKSTDDINGIELGNIEDALERVVEDENLETGVEDFIEFVAEDLDESYLLRPLTQNPNGVLDSIQNKKPLQLGKSESFETPLTEPIVARLEADTKQMVLDLTQDLEKPADYQSANRHLQRIIVFGTYLNHRVLLKEKKNALASVSKHLSSITNRIESNFLAKDKSYKDLSYFHTQLSAAIDIIVKPNREVRPNAEELLQSLRKLRDFTNKRSATLYQRVTQRENISLHADRSDLNELKQIDSNLSACLNEQSKQNYANAIAHIRNRFNKCMKQVPRMLSSLTQVLKPILARRPGPFKFEDLAVQLETLGMYHVLESHDNETRDKTNKNLQLYKKQLVELLHKTTETVDHELQSLERDLEGNEGERGGEREGEQGCDDRESNPLRAGLYILRYWNLQSQELAKVLATKAKSQVDKPDENPAAKYDERLARLQKWRQSALDRVQTSFDASDFTTATKLLECLHTLAQCDDVMESHHATDSVLVPALTRTHGQISDKCSQASDGYNLLLSRNEATPTEYETTTKQFQIIEQAIPLELAVLTMLTSHDQTPPTAISSTTANSLKEKLHIEWNQRLEDFKSCCLRPKNSDFWLDLESTTIGNYCKQFQALFLRLSCMTPATKHALNIAEDCTIVCDAVAGLHKDLCRDLSQCLDERASHSWKFYKLLAGVEKVTTEQIEESDVMNTANPALSVDLELGHAKYSTLRKRYVDMLNDPLPKLNAKDGIANDIDVHLLWLKETCKVNRALSLKANTAYETACESFSNDLHTTHESAKLAKQKNVKEFMQHKKALFDCRNFCKLHLPEIDVVEWHESLPASDNGLGQTLKSDVLQWLEKKRTSDVKRSLKRMIEENNADALDVCENAVTDFIYSCESCCEQFVQAEEYTRSSFLQLNKSMERLRSIFDEEWKSVNATFDVSSPLSKCYDVVSLTWNKHQRDALYPFTSVKSFSLACAALDTLCDMQGIFHNMKPLPQQHPLMSNSPSSSPSSSISRSAPVNDDEFDAKTTLVDKQFNHVISKFMTQFEKLPQRMEIALNESNYHQIEDLLKLCAADVSVKAFSPTEFDTKFEKLTTLVRDHCANKTKEIEAKLKLRTDHNKADALSLLDNLMPLLEVNVVQNLCKSSFTRCQKMQQSHTSRSKLAPHDFFNPTVQQTVAAKLVESEIVEYVGEFLPLVKKIQDFSQEQERKAVQLLKRHPPPYDELKVIITGFKALVKTLLGFTELEFLNELVCDIVAKITDQLEDVFKKAADNISKGTNLDETDQKLQGNMNQMFSLLDNKSFRKRLPQLQRELVRKRTGNRDARQSVEDMNLFEQCAVAEVTKQLQIVCNQVGTDDNPYDIFERKLQESEDHVKAYWKEDDFVKIANCLNLLQSFEHNAKGILLSDAKHQLNKLYAVLKELCQTFASEISISFEKDEFKHLNGLLERAERVEEHLHSKHVDLPQLLHPIRKRFAQEIERKAKSPTDLDCTHCVDTLIAIKKYVMDISDIEVGKLATKAAHQLVKSAQKANLDMLQICNLLYDEGGVGPEVVQEHIEFKTALQVRFTQKTAGIVLPHALKLLEENEDNDITTKQTDLIQELYDVYQNQVNSCIKEYDASQQNKNYATSLVKKIQKTAQAMLSTLDDPTLKQTMPKLIGQLSALWAIQNLQGQDSKTTNSPVQLHAVQVIALFRLLDLDVADYTKAKIYKAVRKMTGMFETRKKSELSENKSGLPGHFVEVGTGQGKSILLGLLSAILALLGFEVSCVCYSRNLSQRDGQSFKDLFEMLQITNKITYGTLSELAEDLCSPNGSIRDKALAVFSGIPIPQKRTSKATRNANRILLVDEADVFFADDFYPTTYNPVVTFSHPSLSKLIRHIWDTKSICRFESIVQTLEYSQLMSALPQRVHDFVDRQLQLMTKHVKTPNYKSYVVVDGRIGYKRQDSISVSTCYGYHTMFAYLLEAERKNVEESVMADELGIQVNCGNFAYAELPKLFDGILGVSGTLQSLSEVEWSIIKDEYGVKKKTYLPSLYGESQLDFKHDRDVVVEFGEEEYHQKILHEIQQRTQQGQPVLVFFESEEKIKSFQEGKYGDLECDIVTEETKNLDHYVTSAVRPNKVTLFPRVFGRGLDFVSQDTKVNASGGVHVLQTFFSEELSEEIQIKGRTARQGEKGTYQMVLLGSNLEKLLDIEEADLRTLSKSAEFYNELCKKREAKLAEKLEKMRKSANDSRERHKMSQTFASTLSLNDLLKLN